MCEPGTRVHSIPSLDEVYISEDPPLVTKADAFDSGERRTLQQLTLTFRGTDRQ
jgi:hypothetical protein